MDCNCVIQLVEWFDKNKRILPWRANADPYLIWVSEVMLQQTRVDTVIPYFKKFIQKFPNVTTLAKANTQEILMMWVGLGYYARARNLHKASKLIVKHSGGIIPNTYCELIKLPGIGDYIGSAIASIAFAIPIPAIDGNVLRVLTRFYGIRENYRSNSVKNELRGHLILAIKKADPPKFNQGLMELGALLCCPNKPICTLCPLSFKCIAYKNKSTDQIPVKPKKKKIPLYHRAVGIIRHSDKVLIRRRNDMEMLGGLWEFPGIQSKSAINLPSKLCHYIKKITALKINILYKYDIIYHSYTHFKVGIAAFESLFLLEGTEEVIIPKNGEELEWVAFKQLANYPFDRASQKIINKLKDFSDQKN